MCFSSPKQQQPAPINIPKGNITPTTVQPSSSTSMTAANRREAISRTTRYGLMSTIKTSGKGTVGTPQLSVAQAGGAQKKLLGE